jgi:hypothetical protein
MKPVLQAMAVALLLGGCSFVQVEVDRYVGGRSPKTRKKKCDDEEIAGRSDAPVTANLVKTAMIRGEATILEGIVSAVGEASWSAAKDLEQALGGEADPVQVAKEVNELDPGPRERAAAYLRRVAYGPMMAAEASEVLRADPDTAWRAYSDAGAFGWFGRTEFVLVGGPVSYSIKSVAMDPRAYIQAGVTGARTAVRVAAQAYGLPAAGAQGGRLAPSSRPELIARAERAETRATEARAKLIKGTQSILGALELLAAPPPPANTDAAKRLVKSVLDRLAQGGVLEDPVPQVSLKEPAAGAKYHVGADVALEWSTADINADKVRIRLLLPDAAAPASYTTEREGATAPTLRLDAEVIATDDGGLVVKLDPSVEPGTYRLELVPTDDRGQTGSATLVEIQVKPQVSILRPKKGDALGAGSRLLLRWETTDDDPDKVEIQLFAGSTPPANPAEAPTATPIELADGKKVTTSDQGELLVKVPAATGAHTLQITPIDKTGLRGTAATMVVDLRPHVEITKPEANAQVQAGGTLDIGWTTTDDDPARMSIRLFPAAQDEPTPGTPREEGSADAPLPLTLANGVDAVDDDAITVELPDDLAAGEYKLRLTPRDARKDFGKPAEVRIQVTTPQ